MLTSPPEIFRKADELKKAGQEFVISSVIAIRGAASAKTGAKAIFDREGRNVLGWVGGGCAESFLARQALEVLSTKTPRIVTVDLDDEVFGLMPCGGVMDVYLEPHFSAPEVLLPQTANWDEAVQQFVHQLGYNVVRSETQTNIGSWREVFRLTALALAARAQTALVPWRNLKGQGATSLPRLHDCKTLCVLGQTRITEEICRLAKILGVPVQLFAQNPDSSRFPVGTNVCELPIAMDSISIPPGAWVIVASHHQLDHKFIAHALHADADYVALVASEKRTRLILADLEANRLSHLLERFFAPAGLVLPTETPTQIAFSILCEILYLQDGGTWT